MVKKVTIIVFGFFAGILLGLETSYGAQNTTTVRETSVQTSSVPATADSQKSLSIVTTTTSTKSTTVKESEPLGSCSVRPQAKKQAHSKRSLALQQATAQKNRALKEAFQAYVNNENQNICAMNTNKKVATAYEDTARGPWQP